MRHRDMFQKKLFFLQVLSQKVFPFSGDVQLHQIWERRGSGDQECHLCSWVEHDQWQGANCYNKSIPPFYIRCLQSYGSGTAFSSLPGWIGILLSFLLYPRSLSYPRSLLSSSWNPHLCRVKQVRQIRLDILKSQRRNLLSSVVGRGVTEAEDATNYFPFSRMITRLEQIIISLFPGFTDYDPACFAGLSFTHEYYCFSFQN